MDGLIGDAGRLIREQAPDRGWFDLSTLREPYRQEGKKTMGIELAEQGGWGEQCLPDVIVYPTGGGTGIVGMWKAFAELEELGWIGARRPRMVVVQAEGCAPIVQAFARGERYAEPWPNAQTAAAGLRVPSAIGDYLILDAVRASGGTALAVSEAAIADAQVEMGRLTGIYAAPEAAATWAAVRDLRRSGFLQGTERVVLFCTGSGLKYDPPRWLGMSPFCTAQMRLQRSAARTRRAGGRSRTRRRPGSWRRSASWPCRTRGPRRTGRRRSGRSARSPARSWPKIRHTGAR